MTLNAVRMAVGVLDPTTALTAFITSSSSRTTPGQTALDCQKLYCSLSVYIYSKSNLQNRTVSLFVLCHLTFCQKSFTWCALALCSYWLITARRSWVQNRDLLFVLTLLLSPSTCRFSLGTPAFSHSANTCITWHF